MLPPGVSSWSGTLPLGGWRGPEEDPFENPNYEFALSSLNYHVTIEWLQEDDEDWPERKHGAVITKGVRRSECAVWWHGLTRCLIGQVVDHEERVFPSWRWPENGVESR